MNRDHLLDRLYRSRCTRRSAGLSATSAPRSGNCNESWNSSVTRALAAEYPVGLLSDLLGLARSTYYHAAREAEDEAALRG